MPRIPREVIEHHLKIHPDAKPVSQKPRRQSIERQDFIHEEVRSYCALASSKRSITQYGWPIQSSFPRLTGSFRCSTKVPKVQPSVADDGPVKTIQVGVDSSQTTRIVGNLEKK
jgi:hypothetical protein